MGLEPLGVPDAGAPEEAAGVPLSEPDEPLSEPDAPLSALLALESAAGLVDVLSVFGFVSPSLLELLVAFGALP